MIETAVEHVATVLGLRPDVVREVNMYKEGDVTPSGQKLVYCNAKKVFDTVKVSHSCKIPNITADKNCSTQNTWASVE